MLWANRVWYEDLNGSGVETISHLRENGRITIMFCAFEGAARILRLFGRGSVHAFGTPEYDTLVSPAKRHASSHAAIVIDVYEVSTARAFFCTCGYAVPLYTFKAERSALAHWASKMEKVDDEFLPYVVMDEELPADVAATVFLVTLDTEVCPRVYAKNGLKAWWASLNRRSHDGLPRLALSAPV
ncbi:hypothetical protein BC628DRAFT_1422789 [Trametes gibbosa]|nr:hypothetical protein BC628DRAFT_1422789 [Trametes gibbosa]